MVIVVEVATGGCTWSGYGYHICVRACTYVLEARVGVQATRTGLETEWTCRVSRQMGREAGQTP